MGASNPPRTPHPSPLSSRESRLWYGIFEGRKREVAGTPVKEKREVPHTLGIYLNISSTVNSNSSYIGDKVAAVSKSTAATSETIQPLMAALGGDFSSFLEVNKVNEFTRRRPVGWRRVSGSRSSFLFLTNQLVSAAVRS